MLIVLVAGGKGNREVHWHQESAMTV